MWTFFSASLSSDELLSSEGTSISELPNMPFDLALTGAPARVFLPVAACSSSSLEEISSALLEPLLEASFSGVLFETLEGDGLAGFAGEDFGAGEKLIFVWRLRPRAFLGAMFVVNGYMV
jgi:hypothetical protein